MTLKEYLTKELHLMKLVNDNFNYTNVWSQLGDFFAKQNYMIYKLISLDDWKSYLQQVQVSTWG